MKQLKILITILMCLTAIITGTELQAVEELNSKTDTELKNLKIYNISDITYRKKLDVGKFGLDLSEFTLPSGEQSLIYWINYKHEGAQDHDYVLVLNALGISKGIYKSLYYGEEIVDYQNIIEILAGDYSHISVFQVSPTKKPVKIKDIDTKAFFYELVRDVLVMDVFFALGEDINRTYYSLAFTHTMTNIRKYIDLHKEAWGEIKNVSLKSSEILRIADIAQDALSVTFGALLTGGISLKSAVPTVISNSLHQTRYNDLKNTVKNVNNTLDKLLNEDSIQTLQKEYMVEDIFDNMVDIFDKGKELYEYGTISYDIAKGLLGYCTIRDFTLTYGADFINNPMKYIGQNGFLKNEYKDALKAKSNMKNSLIQLVASFFTTNSRHAQLSGLKIAYNTEIMVQLLDILDTLMSPLEGDYYIDKATNDEYIKLMGLIKFIELETYRLIRDYGKPKGISLIHRLIDGVDYLAFDGQSDKEKMNIIIDHLETEFWLLMMQRDYHNTNKSISEYLIHDYSENHEDLIQENMPKSPFIETPEIVNDMPYTDVDNSPYTGEMVPVSNGNLLAYWSFDNDTEKTIKDTSGNGNDGKKYGEIKYVEGVNGKAVQFNGVDSRIWIDNNILKNGYPYTLSFWIKVNDFNRCTILGQQSWESRGYNIYHGLALLYITDKRSIHDREIQLGYLSWSFGNGNGGGVSSRLSFISEKSIEKNKWNHIVLVATDHNMKNGELYLNGEPLNFKYKDQSGYSHYTQEMCKGTADYTDFNEGTIDIGAIKGDDHQYQAFSENTLDEIMFFSEVLTEQDVQALYEQGVR